MHLKEMHHNVKNNLQVISNMLNMQSEYLNEDLDLQKKRTLGLQLVRISTHKLKGTVEIDRSEGTEFRITFENEGGGKPGW